MQLQRVFAAATLANIYISIEDRESYHEWVYFTIYDRCTFTPDQRFGTYGILKEIHKRQFGHESYIAVSHLCHKIHIEWIQIIVLTDNLLLATIHTAQCPRGKPILDLGTYSKEEGTAIHIMLQLKIDRQPESPIAEPCLIIHFAATAAIVYKSIFIIEILSVIQFVATTSKPESIAQAYGSALIEGNTMVSKVYTPIPTLTLVLANAGSIIYAERVVTQTPKAHIVHRIVWAHTPTRQ